MKEFDEEEMKKETLEAASKPGFNMYVFAKKYKEK